VGGDALALPFADGSFHAVTTGFAMRNVAGIQAAFAEMRRVTRPGGRVVCLEVARPINPLVRWGHGIYFGRVAPLLGKIVTGQAAAYAYLPAAADLKAIMEAAGWRQVVFFLLGMGSVAIHVGVKD
jgi:demethylmenaquinone methyltransferase/2-methoxy-6-polyprenyl-1,4-benzoquinol methylase